MEVSSSKNMELSQRTFPALHSVILLVKPSDMFSFVSTAEKGKINIMWKTLIESSARENKKTSWEEKEINVSREAEVIKRIIKTG